ncbi:hypothetical protein BJ085DRAFT_35004, partial [Dimargaris cristalligena]
MATASHPPNPERTPNKVGLPSTPSKSAVSLFASPIKADELCINPKWSPHSPSPRSKRLFTASADAVRNKRIMADLSHTAGEGGSGALPMDKEPRTPKEPAFSVFSPFARRQSPALAAIRSPQRLLLSPKSIPPLSPVLSSKKLKHITTDKHDIHRFHQYSSPLSRVSPTTNPDTLALPTHLYQGLGQDPEHSPTAARVSAGFGRERNFNELLTDQEPVPLSSPLHPLTSAPETEFKQSPVCRSLFDASKKLPSSPVRETTKSKFDDLGELSPTAPRITRDTRGPRTPCTPRHTKLPRFASADLLASTPSSSLKGTTISREDTAAPASSQIPPFYFPGGRPAASPDLQVLAARQVQQVKYALTDDFGITSEDFLRVTEICGLPRFTNKALFQRVFGAQASVMDANPHHDLSQLSHRQKPMVNLHRQFARFWQPLRTSSPDEDALVFNLLRREDRSWLEPDDFLVILEDVIDNHPELEFLDGQDIFKERYAET